MTGYALARQLAELRHNTQRLEQRHRALLPSRWQPLPETPLARRLALRAPAPDTRPLWLRRGIPARVLDNGPVVAS